MCQGEVQPSLCEAGEGPCVEGAGMAPASWQPFQPPSLTEPFQQRGHLEGEDLESDSLRSIHSRVFRGPQTWFRPSQSFSSTSWLKTAMLVGPAQGSGSQAMGCQQYWTHLVFSFTDWSLSVVLKCVLFIFKVSVLHLPKDKSQLLSNYSGGLPRPQAPIGPLSLAVRGRAPSLHRCLLLLSSKSPPSLPCCNSLTSAF